MECLDCKKLKGLSFKRLTLPVHVLNNFDRRKLEKLQKIQKQPYISQLVIHMATIIIHNVNKNTNMIVKMLLILLENLVNISHRDKN